MDSKLINIIKKNIYKNYGSFIRRKGLDEDIEQEIALAVLKLKKKNLKNPYLFVSIRNHISSFLKKELKHDGQYVDVELPSISYIEEALILGEQMKRKRCPECGKFSLLLVKKKNKRMEVCINFLCNYRKVIDERG